MGLNSGYWQASSRKRLRRSVRASRALQRGHDDLHTNTMRAHPGNVFCVSGWCPYRLRDAEYRPPHAGMWGMPRRILVAREEPAAGRIAGPQSSSVRSGTALESSSFPRITADVLVRVSRLAVANSDAQLHAAGHGGSVQRAPFLRSSDRLCRTAGERVCTQY